MRSVCLPQHPAVAYLRLVRPFLCRTSSVKSDAQLTRSEASFSCGGSPALTSSVALWRGSVLARLLGADRLCGIVRCGGGDIKGDSSCIVGIAIGQTVFRLQLGMRWLTRPPTPSASWWIAWMISVHATQACLV